MLVLFVAPLPFAWPGSGAGVPCEPDNDTIELLDLLGHSARTSSAPHGRATQAGDLSSIYNLQTA
jgi:hypothetical protein